MGSSARPPCDWINGLTAEGDEITCRDPARFHIKRGDEDGSYDEADSCERHLPDQVAAELDGDDIPVIVTAYWDES